MQGAAVMWLEGVSEVQTPDSTGSLSVLQSSEEQAPVPQNKFMGDIEELAASYERKLIE
ncbi:hypothetical protein INR49_003858, partial [Caranx melampygus]